MSNPTPDYRAFLVKKLGGVDLPELPAAAQKLAEERAAKINVALAAVTKKIDNEMERKYASKPAVYALLATVATAKPKAPQEAPAQNEQGETSDSQTLTGGAS